jgi:predicted DNA-binding transcriptional regulator YafY
MARNDSALRILEIGRMLEHAQNGLTVKEIQSRLSEKNFTVGTRTVYRDIEAASAIFPIVEKEKMADQGTRFGMESMAKVTKYLVLNPRELFALYFSRGLLAPLENTPFFSDIQAVFKKIDDLLGRRGRQHLEELAGNLFFEPGPKWGLGIQPDMLETIRAACEERQAIHAVYSSSKDNAPKPRKLGPHFLYYSRGGIYLVAEDIDAGIVKTYSLPRFRSAEMTAAPYDKQPLDPSQFFASSFGVFASTETENVELEFESCISKYVCERNWHNSQRVVHLEKGRARISFSVALTPEFVAWVLGFGPNVRVTRSEALIQLLVQQASEVRSMYWKKTG